MKGKEREKLIHSKIIFILADSLRRKIKFLIQTNIKNSIYTFNQDTFKGPKYFVAFILIAIGAIIMTISIVVGALIILSAVILASYTFGIQIDVESNMFRYFRKVLFWKTGKWNSFGEYNVMLMLTKKGTKSFVSPSLAQQINVKASRTDVFISQKNHRKRIFVCSSMDYYRARFITQKLSTELKFPIEKYNPQVSRATAIRMAQRRKR